jgi:hypothetical protein
MYYVTYRNVLNPLASLDDYRRGLRHVWPTLQSWGATRVDLYQELYDESGAFYTRYAISSLDEWNRHLMSEEFANMLEHLEQVIDVSQSEVTVTVALESGIAS